MISLWITSTSLNNAISCWTCFLMKWHEPNTRGVDTFIHIPDDCLIVLIGDIFKAKTIQYPEIISECSKAKDGVEGNGDGCELEGGLAWHHWDGEEQGQIIQEHGAVGEWGPDPCTNVIAQPLRNPEKGVSVNVQNLTGLPHTFLHWW